MSNDQALAMVNRTIDQQAYTMAVTDVFYMSAVLFVALVGVILAGRAARRRRGRRRRGRALILRAARACGARGHKRSSAA